MSEASLHQLDRLEPFRANPGLAGILTDFDGTLAPIVDDPPAARPLPEAVDLLHQLARRYRTVAVISGRPAAFLAAHLRLAGSGLAAVGLYGMETARDEQVRVDPRVVPWLPVVEDVAARADREAPVEVFVERKSVSVTLHYRTAPECAAWANQWASEQAARTGLLRHPGRMSEELRPPVPVDKGTVVTELATELSAACFVGDDIGDLPAFRALDDLARDRGLTTLKVAVSSEETPAELLAEADLVVAGPSGVVELLSRLLASSAS